LPTLRKVSRRAVIVVPPRCASLVRGLGFAREVELAPGQSMDLEDVEVTAVAARHDGRRGLLDRTWRSAVGYIVKCAGASVYYAGDTAYFSGFEEIGRRLHPDVALLPIAGYEPPSQRADHMSPLDAVQAFHDLGAKLLVPVGHGSFPLGYEGMDEPLAWLARLCRERGIKDRLVVLRPGESCQVHGRAPESPVTANRP
jgi:L-ascorbate metabolism protein UlaG (beta-lactamase superfamily)